MSRFSPNKWWFFGAAVIVLVYVSVRLLLCGQDPTPQAGNEETKPAERHHRKIPTLTSPTTPAPFAPSPSVHAKRPRAASSPQAQASLAPPATRPVPEIQTLRWRAKTLARIATLDRRRRALEALMARTRRRFPPSPSSRSRRNKELRQLVSAIRDARRSLANPPRKQSPPQPIKFPAKTRSPGRRGDPPHKAP